MSPKITTGRGFSLIELILGATITGLILLASISFFSSLAREVNRPVVVFGGNNYALAPVIRDTQDGVAKTDLNDAIDLHLELNRQITAADLVTVFGGSNVNASIPSVPLPIATSFALQSLTAGASPSVRTTQQLLTAESSTIGANLETSANGSDFTLLAIQGATDIVAIAQVRRYSTTFEGKSVVLYATTLRSRTLPSTTWNNFAYYYWLPANEDVWAVNIGAQHYWYRNDTSWWTRPESAGSTVVFPDPYALSVNASDLKVKPMSRFTYFINTSP